MGNLESSACLMEPMGVAHNILERIDVKGKEVLVIGCGPVGLFCCSVAKVSVEVLVKHPTYIPKIGPRRKEGNRG